MPTHCGDETCPSCVVAGDFIYLAHHAAGFEKNDIKHQMAATFVRAKKTLESVGATLNDMVQINLYLKNLDDFDGAREVFYEYFNKGNFPARMTSQTEFLDSDCLCMIDGVVYKPIKNESV
jgi:2-iminobutanoate/2-iminopropanoate deaminase